MEQIGKIALFIRGPLRPDVKTVIKNIKRIQDRFDGYELDTILLTWKNEGVREVMDSCKIDHLLELKEPTKEYCLSKLTTKCISPGPIPERNFKMFWSQKIGLEFIAQLGIEYDYIITSRPDLTIELTDITKWLKKGIYVMPVSFDELDGMGFTDQFGIAETKIMHAAWNYGNVEMLSSIYSESINPEDCLSKIFQLNNVEFEKVRTNFHLSLTRHLTDTHYPNRISSTLYCMIVPIAHKIFGKELIFNASLKIRSLFRTK